MCLYVTALSPQNVYYVLWGPSAGFPMALTDSTALRGKTDMAGLERSELTVLNVYVHVKPLITSV